MQKKILVAGLFHETHTFLAEKTTLDDFRRLTHYAGSEILTQNKGNGSPMDGFLSFAETQPWVIVPSVQLAAMPSGTVSAEVMQYFNSSFFPLLEKEAEALNGIFLVLHGAMVSDESDDVEGDLLEGIQQVLRAHGKNIPVVGVLDLHANVSAKMIENSSCLYGYRENPHTDAREAAVRAAQLLSELLEKPGAAHLYEPGRYILPPSGTGTAANPMKALLARVREIEASDPDVYCINVWAGYAYADIPACGFSLSCCTRGDTARARSYLAGLAALLETHVADAYPKEHSLHEALALAAGREGPVLLIEAADNIGGGTPGDATGVLAPLLQSGEKGIVAVINDPDAVTACFRQGKDTTIRIEVGARTDGHHGAPVALTARISRLTDGEFELENKNSHLASVAGTRISMGPCAVLENEQLTLLLTTFKTPPMDLGQLHSQGIKPEKARWIIVKAAISHKQAYDPIAVASYYIDSPGLGTSNLSRLPYRNTGTRILSLP